MNKQKGKSLRQLFVWCFSLLFLGNRREFARTRLGMSSSGPVGASVVEPPKSRRKRGGANAASSSAATTAAPSVDGRSGGHEAARSAGAGFPVPLEDCIRDDGSVRLVAAFTGGVPVPRRGINNFSNLCYVAAMMQVLVHCAPFAHLCALLAGESKRCPLTAAVGAWIRTQYWKAGAASVPAPRLPLTLGQAQVADGSAQQDAHEFLVRLLEAIGAEVDALGFAPFVRGVRAKGGAPSAVATAATADPGGACEREGAEEENGATDSKRRQRPKRPPPRVQSGDDAGDGGGWTVVGRGQEKLKVREHRDETTLRRGLIASIFSGTLHSHVKGGKSVKRGLISVTVDPFTVFPVDIGQMGRTTLADAISFTIAKERIVTDEGGALTKTVRFGECPQILVLQLQRYAMTREGEMVKLDNIVEFGTSLVFQQTWCAQRPASAGGPPALPSYQLLSVVSHRGNEPGRGHYVCYSRLTKAEATAAAAAAAPTSGSDAKEAPTFLCANDSRLAPATLAQCIKDTPYLLIYQRVK